MNRTQLRLTVAAIVYYQKKFLLVEEIDKLTKRRVLNQPAGHMEADEDLLSAGSRELFEETGLALQPDSWLGISQLHTDGLNFVRINLIFEPASLPAHYQPQDPDILALHWLTATELSSHPLPVRSALVTDAIQSYLTGQKMPLNLIQNPR
jgi:phosphatase NudJ